jgi:hypothetical protein
MPEITLAHYVSEAEVIGNLFSTHYHFFPRRLQLHFQTETAKLFLQRNFVQVILNMLRKPRIILFHLTVEYVRVLKTRLSGEIK